MPGGLLHRLALPGRGGWSRDTHACFAAGSYQKLEFVHHCFPPGCLETPQTRAHTSPSAKMARQCRQHDWHLVQT